MESFKNTWFALKNCSDTKKKNIKKKKKRKALYQLSYTMLPQDGAKKELLMACLKDLV